LKQKFPLLSELATLVQKRKLITGYSAEIVDKQIHVVSQKLLTNKNFVEQIKSEFPQLLASVKSRIQQERIIELP
jgi:hypothetical protein